ncbi:1-phosphofructokinase [Demequina sp. NBRC 110057]|uniref:1-phosphofructokinase n=1 Tax=Demequina sp. NBRC 110057 TaxID=1570346 RepID=UPI000A01C4E9|nr:1-phosphofructokinase [Demequina sp. NBRC 110057]
MIVTLTPNPSVDRAITVTRLTRGEVNRAAEVHVDAGGKGLNVARAITAQGGEAVAVLPAGGTEGTVLGELLDSAGVPRVSVPVAGAARVNITVAEPDGTTTKLNEPGPLLSTEELTAVVDAAVERADGAAWLVGCGSLPPFAPSDLYATLVERGHARGTKVAIDTSGPALAAAVAASPDLIKPNHEELAELVGRPLPTLADVHDAARALVDGGIAVVAVSLGAYGALLVTASAVLHARATVARPLSTVGAGDCMLAGLLHGLATGLDEAGALTAAVAWGSAAVSLPGSRVPSPDHLAGVHVDLTTTPDLTMELGQS